MTNTQKSTPHSPQFPQAAIPTCGHANNANNFSYEKTPLRYNLVRTPYLAAQPAIPGPIAPQNHPLGRRCPPLSHCDIPPDTNHVTHVTLL